jgi:putative FmdB family regulatory protein
MPIYEYRCSACGHPFDKMQRVDAPDPACPACGSPETQRKVSLSAFHLKGTGFYATDYKPSSAGASESSGESSKATAAPPASSGGSSEG